MADSTPKAARSRYVASGEPVGVPLRRLRQQVAIHLFKRFVLGVAHVPLSPQTEQVLSVFGSHAVEEKTWEAWVTDDARGMKTSKVDLLDIVAGTAISFQSPVAGAQRLPSGFFSTLVNSGLISTMFAGSKSKSQPGAMRERLFEYRPLSAWHLHLDAIEVAALAESYRPKQALGEFGAKPAIPWWSIKRAAGEFLLAWLHEAWGPRSGWLYRHFRPDIHASSRTGSRSATQDVRFVRLQTTGRSSARSPCTPDWRAAGIAMDVTAPHIFKTLFSIAADHTFLIGERASAWSLDLATAALAAYAVAWSDRYVTFQHPVQPELIFWRAFDGLFFSPTEPDDLKRYLLAAMAQCQGAWEPESLLAFTRAGETYREEMRLLGVGGSEISKAIGRARRIRPLSYIGG